VRHDCDRGEIRMKMSDGNLEDEEIDTLKELIENLEEQLWKNGNLEDEEQ
jgi:hypothetical protein